MAAEPIFQGTTSEINNRRGIAQSIIIHVSLNDFLMISLISLGVLLRLYKNRDRRIKKNNDTLIENNSKNISCISQIQKTVSCASTKNRKF